MKINLAKGNLERLKATKKFMEKTMNVLSERSDITDILTTLITLLEDFGKRLEKLEKEGG